MFQDWGGLLGLRVVARNPTRFARFVVANTFLPTGDNAQLKVNDGFYNWKNFVHKTGLRKEGTVGRVRPTFELVLEKDSNLYLLRSMYAGM